MSDAPIQIVVAAFKEENAADQALSELKVAKWAGLIGIQNAAVIRRDKKDKLHIKELKDWGGGKGAVVGGAVGAVAGVLLGPGALLTGAIGATIGGLAAKLRDSGFSNDRLKTLGESLAPGTSAIVAIIEHKWVDEVEKAMAEAGADVVTASLAADIAEQLEAGREVAYTAIESEEGAAIGRMAAGEEDVEVSGVVVTAEGMVATDVVATPEGVVAEQLTATDEGILYEAAAATEDDAAYVAAAVTDEGAAIAAITATPEEEEVAEESEEAKE